MRRGWVVVGVGLVLLGLTRCRGAAAPDTGAVNEPPSAPAPVPGGETVETSPPGVVDPPAPVPDAEAPVPPRGGGSTVLGREEACTPDGWCWKSPSYGDILRSAWSLDATRVFAVGMRRHVVSWQDGEVRFLPSDTPHRLNAIWGSGPQDAWAVGEAGTIVHWDGERWTRVHEGGETLLTVFGTGPSDVWVGGEKGSLLHWDGQTWRPVASGTTRHITALWASGPRDVWAADSIGSWDTGISGSVRRWNGDAWSEVAELGEYLYALWGFGPDDIWVGGGHGLLGHLSGGKWTFIPGLAKEGWATRGLWGRSSQDLWVAGDALRHWDGHTLTLQSYDYSSVQSPVAVAGSSEGPALAVTVEGLLLRPLGDERWEVQRPDSGLKRPSLLSVWASGPNDAWAAGDDKLAHWDGHSWSTPDLPHMLTRAITGTSASDIWAIGQNQYIYSQINFFNGGSWGQFELSNRCVAQDIWAVAPDEKWVACRNGYLKHLANAGSAEFDTGRDLSAVHGTSRDNAWAVGPGGTLLQWDGQRWVDRSVDPQLSFNAVWSFGPKDVWIAANQGVVMHWDGESLSRHDVGIRANLSDLYGQAPDDLWVVGSGGALAHWDGQAWSPRESGTSFDLHGITGAGGALFAVGREGAILHRPAPSVP